MIETSTFVILLVNSQTGTLNFVRNIRIFLSPRVIAYTCLNDNIGQNVKTNYVAKYRTNTTPFEMAPSFKYSLLKSQGECDPFKPML